MSDSENWSEDCADDRLRNSLERPCSQCGATRGQACESGCSGASRAVVAGRLAADDWDAEADYEEQVAPMVAQIMSLCRELGIPVLMSFCGKVVSGRGHVCTSAYLAAPGSPRHSRALYAACQTIEAMAPEVRNE